jgi:hypothetical protein
VDNVLGVLTTLQQKKTRDSLAAENHVMRKVDAHASISLEGKFGITPAGGVVFNFPSFKYSYHATAIDRLVPGEHYLQISDDKRYSEFDLPGGSSEAYVTIFSDQEVYGIHYTFKSGGKCHVEGNN